MEAQPEGRLSITSRVSKAHKTVQIIFKDTGVGIPEHNLSQLFEPFFTTKTKGKGVGLGLAVAYGIIQEHGGAIHVTSKEGEETTFRVELPMRPVQDN
jgi:signal transduction histidine kinase